MTFFTIFFFKFLGSFLRDFFFFFFFSLGSSDFLDYFLIFFLFLFLFFSKLLRLLLKLTILLDNTNSVKLTKTSYKAIFSRRPKKAPAQGQSPLLVLLKRHKISAKNHGCPSSPLNYCLHEVQGFTIHFSQ